MVHGAVERCRFSEIRREMWQLVGPDAEALKENAHRNVVIVSIDGDANELKLVSTELGAAQRTKGFVKKIVSDFKMKLVSFAA